MGPLIFISGNKDIASENLDFDAASMGPLIFISGNQIIPVAASFGVELASMGPLIFISGNRRRENQRDC